MLLESDIETLKNKTLGGKPSIRCQENLEYLPALNLFEHRGILASDQQNLKLCSNFTGLLKCNMLGLQLSDHYY